MHKSDTWKGFWGSNYEKKKKGIDPNPLVIDKKVDYYAELGVNENATEAEIRQAFRRKMNAMYGSNPVWFIYVRRAKALRVLTEQRAEYDKARK